jgi:general nucleoside transport system permease protein
MEEALFRAVLFGTPILLASLGALLAERSGVVNLGVEGIMALAALVAFGVALGFTPLLGLLAGVGVGVLGGVILGVFTVTLRANQFVAGLAVAALGLGASGLLGKRYEGVPLGHPLPEGGLALLALFLAFSLHHFLYRTRFGLYLRSVGENPKAADLFGVSVDGVRYGALTLGGGLMGMAGAYLSLAYRPSWTDGMTGGLGWVAIALVILAAWEPLRAIFGAYLFGLLFFLQFRLQGSVPIPSEAFAAMPYLLVILVLALSGRTRAPKALGVPFERGR